jgi:hypothetical protein
MTDKEYTFVSLSYAHLLSYKADEDYDIRELAFGTTPSSEALQEIETSDNYKQFLHVISGKINDDYIDTLENSIEHIEGPILLTPKISEKLSSDERKSKIKETLYQEINSLIEICN